MGDDPAKIEAMLIERYMLPSALRAREQFSWPAPPMVMFWAPVLIYESGYFDWQPESVRPRKRDWHWILAARTGHMRCDAVATARMISPAELDRIATARDPLLAMQERSARETAKLNSRFGGDIRDFVACTPDLQKVRGLWLDAIDMLGNPVDPAIASCPVRVHSSPLAWLASGCDGVVPVGREIGVQTWLRGCSPGLIADSVAHGEALATKMRREVPRLPRVLVTA